MLVDVPINRICSEIRETLFPPGETQWVNDYARIKESRGRVVGSSRKGRSYGESHGTESGQGWTVGMQRPSSWLPSCFYTQETSPCDIDHRKAMLRGNTTCTRRNRIYNVQGSRSILDTSAEEIGKKNLRAKPLPSPRTWQLDCDFAGP